MVALLRRPSLDQVLPAIIAIECRALQRLQCKFSALTLDGITLLAEPIVLERWRATFQGERPATEAPTLAQDYAIGFQPTVERP
jgi:hypothetical protein